MRKSAIRLNHATQAKKYPAMGTTASIHQHLLSSDDIANTKTCVPM